MIQWHGISLAHKSETVIRFHGAVMLSRLMVVALSLLLSSCAMGSQWPHKNFLEIYNHQVGKSLHDPSLYTRKKIASRRLPSDDVETEYLHNNRKSIGSDSIDFALSEAC